MRSIALYALLSEASPSLLGARRDSLDRAPHACLSLVVLVCLTLLHSPVQAVEVDEAVKLYQTGQYVEALQATDAATKEFYTDVRWWRLRLECLDTLGRYREGAEAARLALRRYYTDAPLRVLGYHILRRGGDPAGANALLEELLRIAARAPWQYRTAEDRVWLGRAAVLMGADAREVLEQFYDQAKKDSPDLQEGYRATGELALLKHDLTVAAETYRAALKTFPDDPELLVGLAQSLREDAPQESRPLIDAALKQNPRHLGALLWIAEDALAHDDLTDAAALLDKVLEINPAHSRAWSLRAVLAHLQANPIEEQRSRDWALCNWDADPAVDHTIGEKLSAAYRFSAGAAYQRRALQFDPQFLPARTQLAQDLLRLGESDEGWQLVQQVQEADAYNVVAFNLATLHDRLDRYTSLESKHFLLHMDRREADVYGQRVLDLLERAHQTLGDKYRWRDDGRITVEILTRQEDFAVRTFGFPGGDGILGVCFGRVITANSPAALTGRTTNWEATLWHEYCHVVTLELTQHRIPRWLSEGISVYEERQANPAWGNRLNRDTRQMIVDGQLTPVSQLNQAFRRPRSAAHFNLAYYQASLVVEYLVDRFGHDTLLKILADVTAGMPINDSLQLRVGALAALDQAFAQHALQVAQAYGPKVDWNDRDVPPLQADSIETITAWLKDRPQHYRGRLRYAQALIAGRRWDEARTTLEQLVGDAPQWAGDDSPYMLLAQVHREQGKTQLELEVLAASALRSDDAIETYRRLIELAVKANDSPSIAQNVERYLAVRPLDEFPYRYAAESGERGGLLPVAIRAARALVALESVDRAAAHYLLAKLLHASGDSEAKRHALLALEVTPRFRDAQKLLLKIVGPPEKQP